MSDKRTMRAEALLDGVTGVVTVPDTIRISYFRRPMTWRARSDVERAWTRVGKYLEIALTDAESQTLSVSKTWRVKRDD